MNHINKPHKENPLFKIPLPKWPEMRVEGKSISEDQAAEIILRTDYTSRHVLLNDKEWENTVIKTLKTPKINDECYKLEDNEYQKEIEKYNKKLDKYLSKIKYIQDIEYIRPDRIGSVYVGGSHGFVDWDGTIGTCGHNIGKWPSIQNIHYEWKVIAREFPYLDLRCQLFSGENCEENTSPIVEYIVKDGVAEIKNPTEAIVYRKEWGFDLEKQAFILNERYCTVKNLKHAMRVVLEKNKEIVR